MTDAITILVKGPMSPTRTDWLRGLLSLEILTGTGFAQPKYPAPEIVKIIGKTMDPMGSMCLRGFRVSRPALFAVSSPKMNAISPCEIS